jgi:KipI family sensor histidine kinase inhibitor
VGPPASILDLRDGAALVDFPGASEEEANRAARALAGALVRANLSGLLDAVPAARTLLLVFDPEVVSRIRLENAVARLQGATAGPGAASRLYRIPVAYGGADGPDLAELARGIGLTPGEFAALHAAAEYRVAFIGFSPGFPYLAGLPERLRATRLASPRPRVPAGSVAIGGPYAGIYPVESPGGWRLIGRTTARLFDASGAPPALLSPGDRICFEPAAVGSLPQAPERPRARASRPVFRILSPGVFSSVQGRPRYGLGSSGIPPGGAMDTRSLSASNAILGNDPGAPALEMTVVGPLLEGLAECLVAVAGSDFPVEYEGRPVASGEPFRVAPGGRIRVGHARRGARAYLAAAGGLEDPRLAGELTVRLAAGEEVGLGLLPPQASGAGPRSLPPADAFSLRAVPAPRAALFTPPEVERFFRTPWRVSPSSDRRGLRLEGMPLEPAQEPEIPPEGMLPGSVEIPPGGHPIVLGPDGPVTGGYPAIATVIAADLALLGQAAPGTVLRFQAVSLDEALDARRRLGSTIGFP